MIQNYIEMISKYSDLIVTEACNSWGNIIQENRSEVEILKDYMLNPTVGVDYMNHTISKKITDETVYELKFASVFCHQKPLVTRTKKSRDLCTGKSKRCELGDLMIVFLLLDKNKRIAFSTAKILQAKKTENLNNPTQKFLYESDLEFNMPANISKNSLCNHPLRVLPDYSEHRNMALSYLILNKGLVINKEIPFKSNLSYSWGKHIQLMMEFKTGLKFTTPDNGIDNGWSCIIDDLIRVGNCNLPENKLRGYNLDYYINQFNFFFFFPEYFRIITDSGIPKLFIFCKDNVREYNP